MSRDGGHGCLQQLRLLQKREPSLSNVSKFRQICLGDWIGRRQAKLLEIFILAFLQYAEIEVRSRGEARATDEANRLSNLDVLARAHVYARQMQILRFVAVRMGDVHHIPFAAL